MKKFVVTATVASLCVMMLAGCGEEKAQQESVEAPQESAVSGEEETDPYPDEAYLENLNVDDYVELGEYIGLEVSEEAPYVSDEQVESYIEGARSSHMDRVEITDRAVQEGDVTDINFVGMINNVQFQGGSADNYELTIGSNSFIDGFEDGMIGMKTGETRDLNLTFPENYSSTDLAGKDVVFTVTLNKIYEERLPEFDDAFVQTLEIDGVSTVEEYKQNAYDKLFEAAQADFDARVETAVLKAVVDNATFKAMPEELVGRYYDRLITNMSYQASMYGMDLSTFLMLAYDTDTDDYEETIRGFAEEAVEQLLAMQAVADKEGIVISDEDVEADLEERAQQYGYESADALRESLGNEMKGYKESLVTEKISEFLVENARVTQTEPETGDAEETAAETDQADESEAESETETEALAESETETETETGAEE